MKKIFIIVIFLLIFSIVEAAGCDALLTRDAAEFIADIVTLARIAVPILLIVLCSSDFVAIVTGQDEKVTKTSISRIVKRFIAAAAFFFVPLIIQLILGIDAVNNALNLVDDPSCGIDGDLSGYKSEEEIQKETEEKIEEDKKKEDDKKEEEKNENKSLNISSSFKEYNSNISYLGTYSLYIPKNATENMPLVVVMPSSPENYKTSRDIFKNLDLDNIPAFILITHHLNNYYTGFDAIKTNIDKVVDEYKIDKDKISITGFSSSGTYMYNVVTRNIGFFSAMVPISSGQNYNSEKIQDNLEYFKKLPMKGYGEKGGRASVDDYGNRCIGYVTWYPATAMKNFFTSLGRINDFTDVGNVCHSSVVEYTFKIDENKDGKSDVLIWMISQTKK